MSSAPLPTFVTSGSFSGKEDLSGARWLKRVEWELTPCKVNGKIPAQLWLNSVDLLLPGDAATWVDVTEDVACTNKFMISNSANLNDLM